MRCETDLQNLATLIFGTGTAVSYEGKSKFKKMSQKAHSEKRGCHPAFDAQSIVCDKWDPFISPSPKQPICHLIQPDGCITAVVLRTNLITYLDFSPTESFVLASLSDRCWRLHTVVLYVFISLMPSHMHPWWSDCSAVQFDAALIWYVIHSCT